jgi:hypothetical protein
VWWRGTNDAGPEVRGSRFRSIAKNVLRIPRFCLGKWRENVGPFIDSSRQPFVRFSTPPRRSPRNHSSRRKQKSGIPLPHDSHECIHGQQK